METDWLILLAYVNKLFRCEKMGAKKKSSLSIKEKVEYYSEITSGIRYYST